ncbi:hypothetical protein [Saccharopolyspora sp. NPDC049426]|uniref:hypothetical protein n=1 Tax=Saccharopolyspora sp. NPDC049426 TaxID=3155652 RepID=UPI003432DC9B
MWPFDAIGGVLGEELKEVAMPLFEAAMLGLWEASLAILREAFTLADQFSMFTVDTRTGPVSVLWPMMLWISGILALGLFFWQMIVTSVRSGRGFFRLVGGPVQYGIALAMTVGLVAGFLVAADGLTQGILEYGLQSRNFQDALTHTTFADGAVDGVKAVVLGICAIFGVIPAGIGFVLEMLFREAAIYALVATIPITAAGLLAHVTKAWFWIAIRWLLACIAMKPVLALALVLGVAIAGGSEGLSGLLAGVGVLIISLLVPFVLFRLFAFVDPNSDPGGVFRDALSMAGVDSYGANSPAMKAGSTVAAFYGGGGGEDEQESANTDRFDDADSDYGSHDRDPDERPTGSPNATSRTPDADNTTGGSSSGGGGGGGSGRSGGSDGHATPPPPPLDLHADDPGDETAGGEGVAGGARPAANRGRVVASDGFGPQLVGDHAGSPDDGADGSAGGEGGSSGGEPALPDTSTGPGQVDGAGHNTVDPASAETATEGEDAPAQQTGGTGGSRAGDSGDPPLPEALDLTASGPAPAGGGPGGGGEGTATPTTPSPEAPIGGGHSDYDAPPAHPPTPASGGDGDPPPAEAADVPSPGPGSADEAGPRARRAANREPGSHDGGDDSDPGQDEGVIPE